MAEPSAAGFVPGGSATLDANIVNLKSFIISGAHTNSIATITTSATISGITAPQYLVNNRTGEIVYAEGISAATFTSCTRGADSSTAAAMQTGDKLYPVISANLYNQVVREIDAIAAIIDQDIGSGESPTFDGANITGVDADHGNLTGLSDDDHTQYIKDSEFTQDSSVLVGTAAAGVFAEETGATLRTSLGLAIGTDVLAEQTIGIANDNLMEVDDADAADNDFAKFTAAGLEGRSYAEVREDLTLDKKSVYIIPIADDTDRATGEDKMTWQTPQWLAGWNLIDVRLWLPKAGTVSDVFSVQIYNETQTADMLSTVCSVDATEQTSDSAATAVVVDAGEDDITSGDVLRIDFDAVCGTVGAGCHIELVFQKP